MFKTHLRRSTRRNTFPNRNPLAGSDVQTPVRHGRCMALVDAHCLSWLQQTTDDRSGAQAVSASAQQLQMLGLSLRQAGLAVDLVRAYWYTDQTSAQPVDDVVLRPVADPDADGGQSLVRAMASDLQQLASRHAVDHVLLVCDDERLWSAVDQAQLQGLAVHMAMDDTGTDFARLQRDDPSWARFLLQADRRVQLITPDGAEVGSTAGAVTGAPLTTESQADLEAAVKGHLQDWWNEEPETERLNLQDELRHLSMGLPQEVDRQLLLRLSRLLGHPLTWPEKKVMRQAARAMVLGEPMPPAPSEVTDANA